MEKFEKKKFEKKGRDQSYYGIFLSPIEVCTFRKEPQLEHFDYDSSRIAAVNPEPGRPTLVYELIDQGNELAMQAHVRNK